MTRSVWLDDTRSYKSQPQLTFISCNGTRLDKKVVKLTILFDTSRSGDSPFDAAAVDIHRGTAGTVDTDMALVPRVEFDEEYVPSVVLAREVASCAAEMGGERDGVAHKVANALEAQGGLME